MTEDAPPAVAPKWPPAPDDRDDSPPRAAKKRAAGPDDEDDARGYTVSESGGDATDAEPAPKKLPNFRKESGRDAEEDDGEPRPKKKKKKKPPEKVEHARSLEGRVLNSGVTGGLLAMVGAVVWFVAGLCFDTIFFYPPVLFIIGLVSFFKGLSNNE